MDERDYLKEMFECYFHYRKMNMNSELPIDRLSDAIIGALSGTDYPKVAREELLSSLISDCDIIKATTEKVIIAREQIQGVKIVTEAPIILEDTHLPSSDWMTLDEICQSFKLSKNNVKSKKWRDDNKFPYHQTSKGAKTTFNKKEVEKWQTLNHKLNVTELMKQLEPETNLLRVQSVLQ